MRIKNKTRQLRLDETESDFALRQRILNYGGNDMNDGSSSSGFSSEQDRTRDTNQYILAIYFSNILILAISILVFV